MRIIKLLSIKNAKSPLENLVIKSSVLRDYSGKLIFERADIEVPEHWSQLSVDILAQKYFVKSGVPACLKKVEEDGVPQWLQRSQADTQMLNKLPKDEQYIGERSVIQVLHRLSGAWTYWGFKLNYFSSEEDAKNFYNEIMHILYYQMAAPNSPQWFNTGLYWSYGITGNAQGHYYFDEDLDKIVKSKNAYERPQPHACFIQSVSDNLLDENGIMNLITKESRLFKYGSGTGSNFSAIRGKGEKLSSGGYSSGLMSFLKVADSAAGAIKSGGTTRRAAKMVVLDVDHPDIQDFVNWKTVEEQKVVSLVTGSKVTHKILNSVFTACKKMKDHSVEKQIDPSVNKELKKAILLAKGFMVPEKYIKRVFDLVKQGIYELSFATFSTDWDSESYYTVSGQNSNNSVRIPNEFLYKVLENESWDLKNRFDGTVSKSISAKNLWDQINYSAWSCADPGIQFSTTINEWHTCPSDGWINASNPCSEYLFLDDTACNLASINLLMFKGKDGELEIDKFKHVVRLLTLVLEISVAMAQFPSERIAYLSYKFRTLGLGYANLGAYLMSIGIAYDSQAARSFCGAITSLLTGCSYAVSAEMAKEKGSFLGFAENKSNMLRVINNHRFAAYNNQDGYLGLSIKPVSFIAEDCPDKDLAKEATSIWDLALQDGEKFGYRNAQVTCIAPTGTIGLLMDCTTTGIEPDFATVKYKSLAGGGYFKIINHTVVNALHFLGYSATEIKDITNYTIGYQSFKNAPAINYNSLKSKGFSPTLLKKLDETVKNVFHIEYAFTPHILGEDFFANVLQVTPEQFNDPSFSVLRALGFSNKDIDYANSYITGSMTIEGAPHLKEEHLPIFDCANLCGSKGTRALSYESHIKMLAAAQSFISGGISKTINMPTDTTIDDCEDAYLLSWKLGVKANALYRDGSKLSQPLESTIFDAGYMPREDLFSLLLNDKIFDNILSKSVISGDSNVPDIPTEISRRKRPKGRRVGYTQKAKINGNTLYIRTGEYADGTLAEVFLDSYKDGVAFKSMMNCFAIAVSIGLQYGVPLDEYVEAFTFVKFDPSGPVDGHDSIKIATSLIDYVFRDLAINYLQRYELAHVPPANSVNNNDVGNDVKEENPKSALTSNKNSGYVGEICTDCHNMTMVRNGTCLVCTTCGATTGCS